MFSVHFARIFSTLFVNSVVDFNMGFTRKRRQQYKQRLNRLSESDTDFMIGQNCHETQPGNRAYIVDETATLNKAKISFQAISSQKEIHT